VKAFACLMVENEEKLGEIISLNSKADAATRAKIETYLMKKWLGKLPAGYADFRDVTVSGEGAVKVPSLAAMPLFAQGFAGEVEFAASSLLCSFAPGAVEADCAHAFPAGATVKFANALAVNLDFASRPNAGRHLLVAGAIADGTEFVLGAATGLGGKATVKLVKADDGLYAEVCPMGTAVIVR